MTPYLRLMLLPLALATISLAGCGAAPIFSQVSSTDCRTISLPPRVSDAERPVLADEIAASPPLEQRVLTDAARVERDLRACQGAE